MGEGARVLLVSLAAL